MKTGNTGRLIITIPPQEGPQWSPVMKTGNTRIPRISYQYRYTASMEPGHEDREYLAGTRVRAPGSHASMEPGHEDREYAGRLVAGEAELAASMEPGHEDREYQGRHRCRQAGQEGLNGARS